MKKTGFYIFFFAVLVILLSCSNTTAQQKEKEAQQAKTLIEILREKANTALVFCNKNQLNTDFCLLVDMKIHSGKNRFFVWDFKNDTILTQSLCAHGYGKNSTAETPVFSNEAGSLCSSLGKYKTGIRAPSKFGINVHYKLHGLENTNNNAFKRIVVLHSFTPVPEFEIAPLHLPLGYSQGCPVIDNATMTLLNKNVAKTKKSNAFMGLLLKKLISN